MLLPPLRLVAILCCVAPAASAAPTVSLTDPAPGTTVSTLTTVSITFSEPVTGVAFTDIGVNGEAALSVTGSGAGPYVFTFPQPAPGTVSLGWDADQVITGIGTGDFSPADLWSYTLTDTIAPTLGVLRTSVAGQETVDVHPAPGSTAGVIAAAVVNFSETVTGVDAADLLVNGAPASAVTGAPDGPYTFTFVQPGDGAVNFTWSAGHGIVDLAGNPFGGTGWSATKAASAGQVLITEFLAENGGGIVAAGSDSDGTRDENWDLSSWIELHNPGASPVTLTGWSLTEDTELPRQWVLPARTLAAGGRLVIWASGKDRKPATGHLHTNFRVGGNGGTLAMYSPDTPAAAPASAWIDYPPQRYDYSYGAQAGDGLPRYFRPPSVSQGAYVPPASDIGAPTPTVPPVPVGVVNGTSTLTGLTPEPTVSVGRGFFSSPFGIVMSCPDATAVIRYTLDGSVPLATSPAYGAPLNVTGTTVLRLVAFGTDMVPSRTVTHSYLFPDTVTDQPSPPYDNPARTTDNGNPAPPSPGGNPLPIAWGTNGTFNTTQTLPGFPTGTSPPPGTTGPALNLNAGQVPADYGMDPKVHADPTKYNDAGAVDAVNGKTNLERIRTALRTLPALSLVIKSGDMFGAYPNGTTPSGTVDPLYPTSSSAIKRDMTKPCSLELIQADGTTVFVIDAGIDLHGNASRDPFKNPKHGFTIRFKKKYGAGKLEANLYPDSPVKEWDKLVLRGDFGGSWLHQTGNDTLSAGNDSVQRPRGIRIREAFCKDTFRDMGRAASHHRFCHLFINGVCWGNYELMEDQAQDFGASYFGGHKDDYDVNDQGKLKSGTWNAWSAMKQLIGWTGGTATTDRPTPPSSATYLSAFSNSQYESLRTYLDLPWFHDYMIHHLYFGHRDWATGAGDAAPYMKNVYFLRNKNGTFKVMPWDMENLMWHQNEDRVTGMTTFAAGSPSLLPPAAIHPRAKNNAEYRLEFADRAWRHMIRPGGALTPPVIDARFDKWTAVMNQDAICLESARWGDYRYKTHAYTSGTLNQVYTWNGSWYDGTGTGYSSGTWTGGSLRFNTGRTVATLGTWSAGMSNSWFDEVRRLKTAYIPVRTTNVLTQFRTNGLFPLLNAPEVRRHTTDALLGDGSVAPGTLIKLTLPTATTGNSSFGDIYYTTDGSDPRAPYELTGIPRSAATLYTAPIAINGPVRIKARASAKPGNFPAKAAVRAASPGTNVSGTYNSTGGASARGQLSNTPLALDGVTLAAGDRILLKNQTSGAVNGIWSVTTPGSGSNGLWDRAPDWDADGDVVSGTWVSVTNGTQNQNSVWRVTNTAATINVGGASGTAITFGQFSAWSALAETTLMVGPPVATVVIAELNYNPRSNQGGSAAEFVEFLNYGPLPVEMTNWSMDGINYIFPADYVLASGSRVVIANNENPATFAVQYPGVVPLGYFGGNLSNGGERISLLDGDGNIVSSVAYDDSAPWPVSADNGGYSLELIDPAGDLQSPANWRASTALKGSPGTAGTPPPAPRVVLSEFLARNGGIPTLGNVAADYVELHNPGAAPADVSGWTITATPGGLTTTLSPGTSIPAGGFLTIPAAGSGFPQPFLPGGLDGDRGTIQLFNATGILQDGVRYGPQATGRGFSRIAGNWALGAPTPGAANTATPSAAPTVLRLNEWLPAPRPGEDDWLELHNTNAAAPVVLTGCTVAVNGAFSRISVPAAIDAGGWVRLYCNNNATRGDAVLLNLPAAGATLGLFDPAGISIDHITYPGGMGPNTSGGRFPDGTATVVHNLSPSPALANLEVPASGLHLGEVLVLNQTGATAPWARRPAWIELANTPAGAPAGLAGWKLRTIGSVTSSWTFPAGISLAPDARLRLWCDAAHPASTASGTNLNTALDLDPAHAWGLELLAPTGHLYQSLTWGRQLPDKSFGGNGSTYTLLAVPTPGTANAAAATLDPASLLKLNEWYGGNSPTPGNFLEIYHPGANPVDLGGLWLGDSPSEAGLRRWQIPALSFLAPQSHALYTADGPAGQPGVLGFDIAKGGEYLRLSANDAPGTAIDEQNFPGFPSLVSQGRLSDGTATLTNMNPTPGFSNAPLGGQLITGHPQSVVTSGGSAVSFRIVAPGATSWQWKFNGADLPGARAAEYIVSPYASPATAGSYTCTVTGTGGTATSNVATLTVLNNFSTWAAVYGITGDLHADPDGDGVSNALEFLTGTSPLIPSTPAQRALQGAPWYNHTPGGTVLGFDLALDPNAVYQTLLGDLSPDLSLWNARPADGSIPVPGGTRLLWNVPASESRHFIRLWLEP